MKLSCEVKAGGGFEARQGLFDYAPADAGAVEWHMNFADPHLFVAYCTPLMAQDELQVAEHPAFGALREALVANKKPAMTVDSHGRPSPVTVTGVQRRCAIDTTPNSEAGRPRGLYGNEFALASAESVIAATRPLSPPTTSNILAMAALSGRFGEYTANDIGHIAGTAYSGYMGAKAESARLSKAAHRTVVHTGFWGCGAFGGNRRLMTILQALAADMAEVDLVFHAFDAAGVALAKEAHESYVILRESCKSTQQILDSLAVQKFLWGQPDGN